MFSRFINVKNTIISLKHRERLIYFLYYLNINFFSEMREKCIVKFKRYRYVRKRSSVLTHIAYFLSVEDSSIAHVKTNI